VSAEVKALLNRDPSWWCSVSLSDATGTSIAMFHHLKQTSRTCNRAEIKKLWRLDDFVTWLSGFGDS
jgi:hypothetical protein